MQRSRIILCGSRDDPATVHSQLCMFLLKTESVPCALLVIIHLMIQAEIKRHSTPCVTRIQNGIVNVRGQTYFGKYKYLQGIQRHRHQLWVVKVLMEEATTELCVGGLPGVRPGQQNGEVGSLGTIRHEAACCQQVAYCCV